MEDYNARRTGQHMEDIAVSFLVEKGYKILERNYRCRKGEIDIIATHNNCIIFVEVKYRSSNKYGSSLEAVGYRKQQIIRFVAEYYLTTVLHNTSVFCRFDVIGIDNGSITHIENAF